MTESQKLFAMTCSTLLVETANFTYVRVVGENKGLSIHKSYRWFKRILRQYLIAILIKQFNILRNKCIYRFKSAFT